MNIVGCADKNCACGKREWQEEAIPAVKEAATRGRVACCNNRGIRAPGDFSSLALKAHARAPWAIRGDAYADAGFYKVKYLSNRLAAPS